VSQLIRLAFHAPEIVEAIADGSQPPDLTEQALITRRIELPLEWKAQQRAFCISPRARDDAKFTVRLAIRENQPNFAQNR
jgi:hypothetical protein